MSATQKQVLVALSGGVDSSVCVRILQQQGYDVQAVVISFSAAHRPALDAARTAADELGIPLHIRYCEDAFEEQVVEPFCQAYANGLTPNPCVVCNPRVKFAQLAAEADERGIPYIASGHYARVRQIDGYFYVCKAVSPQRDQSYMLYRLNQSILRRLLLPVGEYEKPDIRALAHKAKLSSAQSPDSQEICFVPSGDYAAFIQHRGIQGKQGHFIGPNGENLGPHKGVLHYTVGQRRGLGIALGQPVFVKSIQANGNVQLAFGGQEYASSILLTDIHTATALPLQDGAYDVKIRSMAAAVPCMVSTHAGKTSLCFNKPQRAPAPGQAAVLYQGPRVVGGGTIESSSD